MDDGERLELQVIGRVRSPLRDPADAPRQGDEGAPRARLVLDPEVWRGLDGLRVGAEILVLTWLHRARRDVLRTRPRNDPDRQEQGVFTTRSPDRPTRWDSTVCGSSRSTVTRWRSTGWRRSTALLSSTSNRCSDPLTSDDGERRLPRSGEAVSLVGDAGIEPVRLCR